MCGHVAIMTETESTYMYVMIESILWFDDVGIVPGSKVMNAVNKVEWETAWE